MSRLALASFLVSSAGCILVALSFAQLSRASAEIEKLEGEGKPAAAVAGAGGGSNAAELKEEIAKLKSEVARLRDALGKVPVGGGTGASLGDVENAVNRVITDRQAAQRRVDATKSGEMMGRAAEKFVTLLIARLNLTLDQQANVRDILASETRDCVEVWATATTPEERLRGLSGIHSAAIEAIGALLKEEQKVEWGGIEKRFYPDLPPAGGAGSVGTDGRNK